MYISPIRPNFINTNYNHTNRQQPAFNGALSNAEMERVLKLLANKNTAVFDNFNIEKLNQTLESLLKKYESLGIRSIGLQIVPNEDLPKLLGKDFAKYNTKGKIGICAAVGDKCAPIEKMNNIYEARTFLVKENEFNK